MFDAILFDLDGTLLDIDMNEFIPRYLSRMAVFARKRGVPHQGLPERVMAATDCMIQNKNHTLTNIEVFEAAFFQGQTGMEQKFEGFFDAYYELEFDGLRHGENPFAETTALVQAAFEGGRRVAIATNPVFPDIAVRKRLGWAGIGHHAYHLITSCDNMHYTKPHREYYLEIAELLDVEPQRCLMIGNDVDEDMVAGQIGMKTFLVTDRLINLQGRPFTADWHGPLSALSVFLDRLDDPASGG